MQLQKCQKLGTPPPALLFKNSFTLGAVITPKSYANSLTSESERAQRVGERERQRELGSFKSAMDRSSLSSPSSSAASLFGAVDLEEGFSDGCAAVVFPVFHRRSTYRTLAPLVPEPVRTRFFFDDLPDDEHHHFLDSCFLCKKPLAGNRDIFMYRGDRPFCSEECRQEQIEMDEARELNRKFAMRKEQQQKHTKSSSTPKSQKIHARAGTVVAG